MKSRITHLSLALMITLTCGLGDVSPAVWAQSTTPTYVLGTDAYPATGGSIQTNVGQVITFGSAQALRVQSDDKIVIATHSCREFNTVFWEPCESAMLVRYQKDGLLDTSFGIAGKAKALFKNNLAVS